MLDAELGEIVLILLDEISDDDKLGRIRALRPDLGAPASLERMASDRSGAVRQLVGFYRARTRSNPEVHRASA